MTYVWSFLQVFLFLTFVECQNEGEQCVEQHTNTIGRCTTVEKCQSANNEYQKSGIPPTFCSYDLFGKVIVCCKDGSNILQAANTKDPFNPVWSGQSSKDSRRVSERKCEEYSREVKEEVDFIPLIPDPETHTVTAAKCAYSGVELIVGGQDANSGEFPHMAAIGWPDFDGNYQFLCGGSLISPRFVLTAAHCSRVPNAAQEEPAIVRLGDHNIDSKALDGADPIDVPIRNIIKHPDYASPSKYDDIMLLELATDVQFSAAVRPACLWTKPDFGGFKKALATGWGVVDPRTRETSKILQKVSLTLMDNDVCDAKLAKIQNRHWKGFRPTQMCAGDLRGGKDTCQGDSGSPLQIASKDNLCIFHLVGVTSFGKECAASDRPAVYTRVSSYVSWIESVVWPNQ